MPFGPGGDAKRSTTEADKDKDKSKDGEGSLGARRSAAGTSSAATATLGVVAGRSGMKRRRSSGDQSAVSQSVGSHVTSKYLY